MGCQHRAGDTPGSITTLREATYAAEAADAVRTEIDAWSSLVRALAIASKLDEACCSSTERAALSIAAQVRRVTYSSHARRTSGSRANVINAADFR